MLALGIPMVPVTLLFGPGGLLRGAGDARPRRHRLRLVPRALPPPGRHPGSRRGRRLVLRVLAGDALARQLAPEHHQPVPAAVHRLAGAGADPVHGGRSATGRCSRLLVTAQAFINEEILLFTAHGLRRLPAGGARPARRRRGGGVAAPGRRRGDLRGAGRGAAGVPALHPVRRADGVPRAQRRGARLRQRHRRVLRPRLADPRRQPSAPTSTWRRTTPRRTPSSAGACRCSPSASWSGCAGS